MVAALLGAWRVGCFEQFETQGGMTAMVSYRKSVKVAGVRLTFSNKGVSSSVGAGPVRVTRRADGTVTRTVSGGGFTDTKRVGGQTKAERERAKASSAQEQQERQAAKQQERAERAERQAAKQQKRVERAETLGRVATSGAQKAASGLENATAALNERSQQLEARTEQLEARTAQRREEHEQRMRERSTQWEQQRALEREAIAPAPDGLASCPPQPLGTLEGHGCRVTFDGHTLTLEPTGRASALALGVKHGDVLTLTSDQVGWAQYRPAGRMSNGVVRVATPGQVRELHFKSGQASQPWEQLAHMLTGWSTL